MWEKLYLDMLKERDLKHQKDLNLRKRGITDRTPQVGDVVILIDERGKMGDLSRVIEVQKSKDGFIRQVKVLHKLKGVPTWWPICGMSFLEVRKPDSIPRKFWDSVSDENIQIPTQKLKRLIEKQNMFLDTFFVV